MSLECPECAIECPECLKCPKMTINYSECQIERPECIKCVYRMSRMSKLTKNHENRNFWSPFCELEFLT